MRINADRLTTQALSDHDGDSEDEMIRAIRSKRPNTVFPVTIGRKEEKGNYLAVVKKADDEGADKDESLWISGSSGTQTPIRTIDDDKVWYAAPKSLTQIKQEPGTETAIDLSTGLNVNSPPQKKPAVEEILKEEPIPDREDQGNYNDRKGLLNAFGASLVDEQAEIQRQVEGRVHLFQFPPVLPPLHVSNPVKTELDDMVKMDAPGTTSNVDLTQDDDSPEQQEIGVPQLPSQGGFVGRLNIRKSGKAEFDWGGFILEMEPAETREFLANVVIVEEADGKPKHGAVGGNCYSMGKVWDRYVLAPAVPEPWEWEV
jgi:DNA-directed RNA polymerase III subunit RPC4